MPGASLRELRPEPAVLVALRAFGAAVGRYARGEKSGPQKASSDKRDASPIRSAELAVRPPRSRLLAVVIGALVLFAVVMIVWVPFQYEPVPVATPLETTQGAAQDVAPVALDKADASPPPADAPLPPAPPAPKVFRVTSLKADPAVVLVEGTVGKRTVVAALAASGLSMRDSYRVLRAFKGKTFDRPSANETFVYAKDRQSGRLVAFEYIAPPFDVWQAREADDGRLEGKKVVFTPEARRVVRSVTVGEDLRKSLAQAELDDDLLGMLDDALDGHAELVDMRPGARLRIVAEEERIEGTFARYTHLDAVEYFPANLKAKQVRVYRFDPNPPAGGKVRSHTFYDEHGRQPYKGGFRSPLPLGRITSRFNPRRMHPVLKVIMPHNGVDFAAPIGTPIYATAPGIVRSVGMAGPNGNMVQVEHANGLTSAYCHLSRFAAGLRVGQHVEGRQLVGYVGQTGRSTGPHLHFAIKRGDTFLNPMSLRMDGWRTVPPHEKEGFDKVRAALDAALETVAAPAPPEGTASSGAETEDIIYDDVPDGGT